MGGDGPRRRAGAVLALAILVLPGPRAVPAGADLAYDEELFAARLFAAPALVRVQSSWAPAEPGEPGPPATTCTGFLVHTDGFVVTAGRCVDPDHSRAGERTVTVTIGDGVADHAPVVAAVLEARTGPGDDVALLGVPGRDLVPLVVARSSPAKGKVLVSGFPATAPVTDGDRAESFETELHARTVEVDEVPDVRISRAVGDGLLGGPVVDARGAVVGVSSRTGGEGSPTFTRVTSAERVMALLRRHRVENHLGPVGEAAREGVRVYATFDWDAATEALERALALNPNLPTIQRLRERAAYEVLFQVPSRDRKAPWALVAVAIAGVGTGVVGLLLLRRRRKARLDLSPSLPTSPLA